MSTATLTRKRTYTTIEVSAEVDISDLADNGWHHEDDCPEKVEGRTSDAEALREAVASLHQQAHPGESHDPVLCREEPCRSLTMDQLRGGR